MRRTNQGRIGESGRSVEVTAGVTHIGEGVGRSSHPPGHCRTPSTEPAPRCREQLLGTGVLPLPFSPGVSRAGGSPSTCRHRLQPSSSTEHAQTPSQTQQPCPQAADYPKGLRGAAQPTFKALFPGTTSKRKPANSSRSLLEATPCARSRQHQGGSSSSSSVPCCPP